MNAYIIGGYRSAVGKAPRGVFKNFRADDLAAKVIEKLVSDFQTLETFEPDLRSVGFARLIENLLSDIRLLERNDELRTPDEISKKDLMKGIQEFLPKIEEYS